MPTAIWRRCTCTGPGAGASVTGCSSNTWPQIASSTTTTTTCWSSWRGWRSLNTAPPSRTGTRRGGVYLDYIRVIKTLQDIQQMETAGYELERLHGDVTSLCSRIELLPCSSARDRLAQSEMAKRVANILRVVLTLQQGGDSDSLGVPLGLLAPHISRLPMPEDYTLEELRGLTQSYLRQLIVGQ
ncbi:nuclear pore complex protein Nup98-Nup96-like [Anarrhichthys ocellatus]|uniref:nuclear pore complex protein Nup98-Nup96-like n=1 Tax=Anarrhichthys ocellatus TaxID=433405 RepID=UPI0012ED65F8|nr:nuclear pore complex protein Nup98-Nup96-like [Anarrhichthys ocellatus]